MQNDTMATSLDLKFELNERNDQIIQCMTELKIQRDELSFLIEKQQEEKLKLETEIERIKYKLCLINKSLSQRIATKINYDKTIDNAERAYVKILESSNKLLQSVASEAQELQQIMDKKIGTESK